QRAIDRAFGWLLVPFNRMFVRASHGYVRLTGNVLRRGTAALVLYAGIIGLGWLGFSTVPTGFIPQQDKQYLVGFAQLPAAASLDRTEAVIRRMGEIALAQPGVENAIAFPGLNINGFVNSSNAGVVFIGLTDFDGRKSPELSAG